MKQEKKYRYIGRNGIITSNVLLDGISHIALIHLTADDGFVLTNGKIFRSSVTVEAEDAELWYEIVDNTRKDT